MDELKDQLIYSNNDTKWFSGSPLALCSTGLYKEPVSGGFFAKVKFINVQPEPIKAVTIDIICYDIIRNEIDRVNEYTIDNIKIERNKCFENSEEIIIENCDTMAVDILLKRVTAQDGETWVNETNSMFDISLTQNNISFYMGRYFDKFRTEWSEKGLDCKKLIYAPYIGDDYWLCTCGTLNWSVERNCCECGADVSWLIEATDTDSLKQQEEILKKQAAKTNKNSSDDFNSISEKPHQPTDQNEEYERKNAVNHKSRKKVKIFTGFTIALLALVALTLGIYFIIIPANNYYSAVSLIDEKKYDQAITELKKLDGYGDSDTQIQRANYLKAEELASSGNFVEAADIFYELGDYSDSNEKYNQTMYQYGEQQFDSKDYISALETFSNLKGYDDASEKAKEAEQAAFSEAQKLLDDKKYSEASELFLKIADITGSKEAIESSNLALHKQADKLYNNYKYVDALLIYESISGYDHVDVTLKKLDNLRKVLSTSIHIGDNTSIWESEGLPCPYCHMSDSLTYQFYFNANGTYEFDIYCPNHEGNKNINEVLTGQYKIENDTIYTLEHNGGDTSWSELAKIENITLTNDVPNKNAVMVLTNPFAPKSKNTLSLYGNIVDQNSSPI